MTNNCIQCEKLTVNLEKKSTFLYDVEDKEVTQHKANGVDMGQGMGRGWRGGGMEGEFLLPSLQSSKSEKYNSIFNSPHEKMNPHPTPAVKAMTNAQNRTDISSK